MDQTLKFLGNRKISKIGGNMDKPFLESFYERDIDLLFLEEFNVSKNFGSWLVNKIFRDTKIFSMSKGAWHSICDSGLGESDLVYLFFDKRKNTHAILIENKIGAIAQPKQAERYKKRGEKGIKNKYWSSFKTCLFAPDKYLENSVDAKIYDHIISYEEIADWFVLKSGDKTRNKYKSDLIRGALDQNKKGYSPITNKSVTEFWMQYWEHTKEKYPELKMYKPLKKPANSDWIYFHPIGLEKTLVLVHKMARGAVDLQITGAAEKYYSLYPKLKPLRKKKLNIEIANKSIAIRASVPFVDRFSKFDEQFKSIDQCLRATKKLSLIKDEVKLLIN